MRDELLRRLYYGEIQPWERTDTPGSVEQQLSQKIEEGIQVLRCALKKECIADLERLLDDIEALKADQVCQAFIDGYRLGAQMMLETLEVQNASGSSSNDDLR